MILEKQTEALVLEEGQSSESIAMSLDLDSAQILMQMLSKNLYSDSIGSTIRECASNALDSHRRAGIVKPIIVHFGINSSSNYEFSVEDFGVGLDDEDVRNIISKYGKSTKRNSESELGMMGLGFKAPLAYSSSFYFVCRKNGVERKYMMYEGEDTNTIDLLYTLPTTDPNGVKVIVPVKYSDRNGFVEKMKEQLAYFENVYFDSTFIKNDFEIYRNDIFQSSTLSEDSYMHICLDNVYYPIDFGKLGIDSIRSRIALRFSLTDGIYPTPNRESIRYTQEAKEKILKKINDAADFFVEKYNATIKNTTNIIDIFKHYKGSNNYFNITDKISVDISEIKHLSKIPLAKLSIENCKHLDSYELYCAKDYIMAEYDCNYIFYGSRYTKSRYWNVFDVSRLTSPQNKYYIYSKKFTELKKVYIKKYYNRGDTFFIIKKARNFTLFPAKGMERHLCYYEILKLKNYPKSDWRAIITEFQGLLKQFEKTFINLDDMVIPQSFIDSRKKQKAPITPKDKIEKIDGDLSAKQAVKLEKTVGDNNCKFVSVVVRKEFIMNSKKMVIYGSQDDARLIDDLYGVVVAPIDFYIFSQREYAKLEAVKPQHWMSIKEFMKGENKLFKRLVTSYKIHKLKDTYKRTFSFTDLNTFSNKFHNKINILGNYKYYNNLKIYSMKFNTVMSNFEKIADEKNLYDHNVYHVYLSVCKDFEKLYFLDPMLDNIRYWTKSEKDVLLMKAIIDLMKYHKYSWK
jgi:hypothetical protein